MRAALIRLIDALKGSYWFLPAVMALGAAVLAWTMVLLDTHAEAIGLDRLPWTYATHPDGARQMLSSIGGSMVTVAGTVFSVTIAAVVYASGQYGPRLLSNFMNDRGNQITLGTFIATFVYCLLVLRTIRSADESGGSGFVPDTALLIAVILALCSIAVLIFFIHHVPSKLHISNVVEEIGAKLIKNLEDRFPRSVGGSEARRVEAERDMRVPEVFRSDASSESAGERTPIASSHSGYLQLIDDEAILRYAKENDLVLRLQYQPGDFVHRGRTLVEAWPAERCTEPVRNGVRSAFAVGARRTPLQDLRFLIDELVEIAARALSPGVNDPFTAITCLDWLGAAMSDLSSRDLPSHLRIDDCGALRVIAHPITFDRLFDRSFGALAQYCAGDMVAALRYVRALGEISLECGDSVRLACVLRQLDRFVELAGVKLAGFNLSRVNERANALRRALAEPDCQRHLRDTAAWLGGTS